MKHSQRRGTPPGTGASAMMRRAGLLSATGIVMVSLVPVEAPPAQGESTAEPPEVAIPYPAQPPTLLLPGNPAEPPHAEPTMTPEPDEAPEDFPPTGPGTNDYGPPDEECGVSDILEPECGVLWGASPGPDEVTDLEEIIERQLDLVYVWHGVDQTELPTDEQREMMDQGRLIHANIEAREFTEQGHPALQYEQIIDGEFDDSLAQQARNFAELDLPAFVTFDHEADANHRYNQRGTPEEFVQAWQRIVDIYTDNGADNVVWVWNVTGWPGNHDRLPGLWPGNDYVDWLSWEGYNMTGCPQHDDWDHVQSFDDAVRPTYEWVQEHGRSHDINPDKPVMIGEMGTVPIPGDHRSTFNWYREVPEVLRELDRIQAVKLWNSSTSSECDFRVTQDLAAELGYLVASQDSYVRVPDEVGEQVLGRQ